MIEDYLPRYKEVTNTNAVSYTIIWSHVLNAHETAWLTTSSPDAPDKEKNHLLVCDCNFIEGIGWNRQPGSTKHHPEDCSYREHSITIRELELYTQIRIQYYRVVSYLDLTRENPYRLFMRIGILYLLNLAQAGEYIPCDKRAYLVGGHFSIQDVARILRVDPASFLISVAKTLEEEERLRLIDEVIFSHRASSPDEWKVYREKELLGFFVRMLLPGFVHIPAAWRIELWSIDKSIQYETLSVPLDKIPNPLPDLDDLAVANREISRWIARNSN